MLTRAERNTKIRCCTPTPYTIYDIDLVKMTSSVTTGRRIQEDEPSTDSHLELLTEHFGFNPRVFVDALVYAANEHLYSIGGQFEEFAKKQLKTSVKKAIKREKEAKHDVNKREKGSSSNSALAKMTATQIDAAAERGVHGVLTLMENALDHVFDLLELYCLKTVFGIKPSQAQAITLKHHRNLDLRTAEERVADGDALSAQEECIELERKEMEMQQKLEKARKTRHALRIANLVADQNLARTNKVADTFAFMIDGSGVAFDTSTPQLAKKLRYDAQELMDALDHLSSTNPLGPSLINAERAGTMNEREKKAVIDASGASEKDKRAWERGREAYINWEMDRIIKSVQTRGSETADHTIASFLFASPSKDASIYSTAGPKRRRTTYSSGARDPTETGDNTRIGEVEDVEVSRDFYSNVY
jgi:kinetochore protein Mis12/MTW1